MRSIEVSGGTNEGEHWAQTIDVSRLQWLAAEDILDFGYSARRLDGRTGDDAETLLRGVEHLLDARDHARDIGGDERVLDGNGQLCQSTTMEPQDIPQCSASMPRAAATT